MLNHLGFPAYQKVFRANSAYLFSWQDHGPDLDFAQKTSVGSQFAPQWQLRVMAQDTMLIEIANSKLRRFPERDRTFGSAGVAYWGSVVFD